MAGFLQVDVAHDVAPWRRMGLVPLVFALLAVTIFTQSALAQSGDEVIRIDTELAVFEVSVTDVNGRPVTGLKKGDFKIYEDGSERTIEFFQPLIEADRRRPLLTVFALDVSGSMTDKELDRLRDAMDEFVRRLSDPYSYFAITTFAMDVDRINSFTNRPEKIRSAFKRIKRDRLGLSTHAYDAIDDAVRMIDRNAPRSIRGSVPKRSVIVITDGFPVGDVVAPDTVIERANAGETSVYSVIMPSFSGIFGNNRPVLTPFEASGVVEKTGGISLFATDGTFEPLFKELAEKISGSYALAFYPEEARQGGEAFRNVRIETKDGLRVTQNRPGYRPK